MPVPPGVIQRAMQPPGGGAVPTFPRSPAGSPNGAGSSPMVSPGGGAGNAAAARALVGQGMTILVKALAALPPNTPEFQSLTKALTALSGTFGKQEDKSLVPATLQQLAMASRSGSSPMATTVPPLPPGLPAGPSPAGGPGAPDQQAA